MDKSAISLDRMRTFVRVAESGSLSLVSREAGMGQSTVTRHINELEASVGVALLSRTTRRVMLTEEGTRYYAACVQILRLVDQATDEAREARLAAEGTVRLSCTSALGTLHIARLIFEFQDSHPNINVDFSLTDDRIDLVRDGVDLALRLGPLADSSMKLHALGTSNRSMVASPDYLRSRGAPEDPVDLANHECIVMANVGGSDRILFTGPDGSDCLVPVKGRLRVDNGLAAREAFTAGRGLGPAHLWLVHDLLAEGKVETLLDGFRLAPVPANLLIVPERAAVKRVRLLIDFLAETVPGLPGFDSP
ncbi:LysR family transcriptional regulator [Rhodobacterales bacterium]|nr:LysR family transcriptional regulator [Rhodobacterales bacterium]